MRSNGDAFDAARITGVTIVDLVRQLAAGDAHLVGVDDDDEVAGVDVRRVLGFVLAAQPMRDLGRQSSERTIGSVHNEPVVANILRTNTQSFHIDTLRTGKFGARMLAERLGFYNKTDRVHARCVRDK